MRVGILRNSQMAEVPALLDKLLRPGAPSGHEGPAASVWREEASFAELSTDGLGSSIARIGETGPLFAVVGHIDEIGLVITHVDEKGFLWFAPIGGWDPQILVGQRVEVRGREGLIPGVVGRKPIHLLDGDQRKKVVELKGMHIDIGAADRDEAAAMVRVGDPVVIAAEPQRLAGDRLVSRAMDNRLGAYVALEALRRCHERGSLSGSFAAVAAVQEEIGLFGARTAAFEVRPDIAVAVDVTHAAEAEGIDYTLSATGRSSHTDADAIQISRSGVPTGLVSIPLRYMHSPDELVDLRDLEATVELIAAFAARIDGGIDLSR